MRFQGKIKEWKDDKGFGFVAPNGGGRDIFLHISGFSARHRRPRIGDLVTYEITETEPNRPRATNARFVHRPQTSPAANRPSVFFMLVTGVALAFAGHIAYVRLSNPNSSVSASVYKVFFAQSALRNEHEFQCTPKKTYCSEMTSCSEAFFFQERCGGTKMDGDRDGIPCEQQWCR